MLERWPYYGLQSSLGKSYRLASIIPNPENPSRQQSESLELLLERLVY